MQPVIRRLICFVLALALCLSLAACGTKTEQTDNPDSSASNSGQSGNTSESQSGSTSESQSGNGFDSQAGTAAGDADAYNGLFDTSRVHTVDVTISDEDWSDLRTNPTEKTKYHATVVIDGETVEEVSFATKGNTSLSSVASDPDSDRYSFKLNFGKYNKGQTYHGLNKLNLNNLYADATYLKDYLSYEIFRQAGVDAPLVSYVWLTVNGSDHGLYLAIEDISEGWLDRTNEGEGELYKPETEMLDNIGQAPQGDDGQQPGGQGFPSGEGEGSSGGQGGQTAPDGQGGFPGGNGENSSGGEGGEASSGGQGGFPGGNGQSPPEGGNGQTPPEGGNGQTPPEGGNGEGGFPGFSGGEGGESPSGGEGGFPGGNGEGGFPGGMGFGGSSKGADLKYVDDDPASYSDIFDNDETDADEAAQQRVIAALKALSEGTDLETYLDTEEIIRYFAAHNFTLNYDSYTGSMLHNYYLYEKDGKLSMLPWDYNLAYGGFGGGADATELINTGIDSPLNGSSEDSRPMWAWIAANEDYLEQYHQVYDELLSKYFESGAFEAQIDALYALLRPYVEKDPSAFYTLEEFDTAFATLKQFCLLRAQSIRAQLSGSLAAKTSEQNAADRSDASGVNVDAMGSQMGGGQGGPDGQGGFPGGGQGGFPGGQNGPGESSGDGQGDPGESTGEQDGGQNT